ncbi:hypothetical protein CN213_06165 [Sinorhizobium meliloti]|uniref:argonaute/piwi family protein n=1 Tax=Rhizobium meliloti TaxID=382 RepID=UPI000FD7E002|nr:hypothetical protein [Sinorhizobium meliloti]RVH60087.1 hypothetical protein CN213_06165 [Sinorhizobium meliloti]
MKKHSKTPGHNLIPFSEPRLKFGYEQVLEDPKDGLLLFGPPEKSLGLQYGVIGTPDGLRQFDQWIAKIQKTVPADENVASSTAFPGFETVFRAALPSKARVQLTVDPATLGNTVKISDPHQRVFDTVDLFALPIQRFVKEEDPKVALWFVVIPEEVWKLCRPQSTLTKREGIQAEHHLSHSKAMELLAAPDLFEETNLAAEKHLYENHFHNQLKAKLLNCEAVTQIVRQTTIAPNDFLNARGKPARKLQDDATIAWNLGTAIYYKSGAKPWTLSDIRDGVCYIGLVFKRTNNPADNNEACCGAQMFLHTGEGIVFKGAVGAWGSDRIGEFHLSKEKAAEIVGRCVDSYISWHGKPPQEIFIHGRTRFNGAEIEGFRSAVPSGTTISGIQITKPNDLKLFREGRRAVLRGLALEIDHRNAFLWTMGYVPKLATYPGREVPTPLKIRIVFGDTRLHQVLADVLALTKLNFNACLFSDGLPVTLRFADDIGEILTAIPGVGSKPLSFRHYI